MGQHLKRVLGIGVYTVGTFALAGSALVGQDEPVLETLKDGPGIDMHPVFRSLSGEDFFIDLRSLPKEDQRFAKFFEPATVRTENEVHAAILASDFDGLIVLQQVSAPKMEF